MSRLRPKEKSSTPTKRSWGPCFIIVDDDNPLDAKPWCIESDPARDMEGPPTPGQVMATAEKVVRLSVASLKGRHRWERYNEPDMEADSLRGKEALSAACEIIRAGPDSAGKRFLAGSVRTKTMREVVAKSMTMPRKPYKSVAQQVREMYEAPKPLVIGQGPIPFDPKENPVETD